MIAQNPAAMKSPPHGAILRHQAVLLLPTIPQLWVAGCVLVGFRNKKIFLNPSSALQRSNETTAKS